MSLLLIGAIIRLTAKVRLKSTITSQLFKLEPGKSILKSILENWRTTQLLKLWN